MGRKPSRPDRGTGYGTADLLCRRESEYIAILDPFFEELNQGSFRAVTSVVTLLEVLVQPIRRGNEALAHQYNDILLSSPNLTTSPVTFAMAHEAAELRARYSLKTPDAIQLATAIQQGATTFLTNDRDFPAIPGVAILRLKDITA